jgi:Holliday junction resolvasome RuvABC endonuclease subunit
MTQTIVGIDMSFRSPAICVLDAKKKMLWTYFIRQRQRNKEHNGQILIENRDSCFYGWTYVSVCLDASTQASGQQHSLARMQQFRSLLPRIVAIICSHGSARETLVAIEHYAFNANNRGMNAKASSSQSLLMELGGCLRFMICCYGFKILELSPSTIKKTFSGSGRATKEEMYAAARNRFHLPDIATLIGVPVDGLKHIPHPVEDVVDAIATAVSARASI